jgi:hypothetical protein
MTVGGWTSKQIHEAVSSYASSRAQGFSFLSSVHNALHSQVLGKF